MNTQQIIDKYGEPGSNQAYCVLPYRMKLAWQLDVTVSKFSCHKDIKDNLEALFTEVLDTYGIHSVQELSLDIFGGCLNIRPVRGGSNLSTHSWGLAVDLDPAHNQLRWNADRAKFAGSEYNEFWKIVKAHGGYSMGQIKNYDWMHFQFIPIK